MLRSGQGLDQQVLGSSSTGDRVYTQDTLRSSPIDGSTCDLELSAGLEAFLQDPTSLKWTDQQHTLLSVSKFGHRKPPTRKGDSGIRGDCDMSEFP